MRRKAWDAAADTAVGGRRADHRRQPGDPVPWPVRVAGRTAWWLVACWPAALDPARAGSLPDLWGQLQLAAVAALLWSRRTTVPAAATVAILPLGLLVADAADLSANLAHPPGCISMPPDEAAHAKLVAGLLLGGGGAGAGARPLASFLLGAEAPGALASLHSRPRRCAVIERSIGSVVQAASPGRHCRGNGRADPLLRNSCSAARLRSSGIVILMGRVGGIVRLTLAVFRSLQRASGGLSERK